MTIYLISELYPVDKNDTSITHAIRYFAENWDEDVRVFRPLQLSLSQIHRFGKYRKLLRQSPRQPGRNKITFFLLIKIPFVRKYLFRIKRQDLGQPPHVIAGHSLMGNYVACNLAKRYGVPFSAGLHNYDIFKLEKEKKAYERVFQQSKLIACRSLNIEKMFKEVYGSQFKEKMFVAHSGVEEEQIESPQFFSKKAEEKKELHFISAARLDAYKYVDINIEVLSQLNRPFRYTIIGDGPERSNLQEQIENLQLTENIEILGWQNRSQVLEAFKKADVFLMISAPETFGLAYVEAMAKACIVVGARGWGIDGLVQHGKNGFLAEARDQKSLKEIVQDIVNLDNSRRTEILDNTRNTVLQLTTQKVADKYLDRLKDITKE